MKTKTQILNEIMSGETEGITEQEIRYLYQGMPLVASAVWDNILKTRTQDGDDGLHRWPSGYNPAN